MGLFFHDVTSDMDIREAARRVRRSQTVLIAVILMVSPAHTVPLALRMAPNASWTLIAGAIIGTCLFALLVTYLMTRFISVEKLGTAIQQAREKGKSPKILALPGILLMAGLTLPFGWFVLPRLLS